MQRCKQSQLIDRFDCSVIDADRTGEKVAAMHHSMAHAGDTARVEMLSEPTKVSAMTPRISDTSVSSFTSKVLAPCVRRKLGGAKRKSISSLG